MEARRVRAALNTLTRAAAQAIELAYFGGYTHTEVATMLDLPVGTAKTRIRDGLIRLRDRPGSGRCQRMSDIHALSGAYAVDALDDARAGPLRAPPAECADCRAEVASPARGRRRCSAETTAVAPPAALRDRVLAGITTVRPLPPVHR